MPTSRPAKAATPPKAAPKRQCRLGDLFKLLGESYMLDILYVALSRPKPHRFVDLQRELKMSPNTLSARLRALVNAGLLTRTAFSEIPPRVEYQATKKAVEFGDMFEALDDWAKRNSLEPVIVPAR